MKVYVFSRNGLLVLLITVLSIALAGFFIGCGGGDDDDDDDAASDDDAVGDDDTTGPDGDCDGIIPTNTLLTNGGFERPDAELSTILLEAGEEMDGWIVAEGNVETVSSNTGTKSAEGHQWLDVNGSMAGAIYQDVTTEPGAEYEVLFCVSGNPGGGSEGQGPKVLQVLWDGEFVAEIEVDTTGREATKMDWEAEKYKIPADLVTGETSRLELRSLSDDQGAYGPAVDAVALVPLP
ncbi:MAG: DUF642 domain-containing protein [Candidatus Lernaella stagnicola]|nr:DUF642 domain-containing protein [Candidatus Lernaella stagnicola]